MIQQILNLFSPEMIQRETKKKKSWKQCAIEYALKTDRSSYLPLHAFILDVVHHLPLV